MRDLLPEFLEDVARDDASARATEAAGGAGEAPRGFLARAWSLGKSGSRRGRETKQAPRDDRLSARFLAEASAVTAAIEAWRRDLADLRRAHAAAADAASTRALAETRRALLEKTTAASETAACLASTVDALERGGETFSFFFSENVPFPSDAAAASAEPPSDLHSGKKVSDPTRHHPTPHHERLVRTVAAGVRAKFAAAARAFGDVKADARRRREEALSTRHFARHATVPNLDAARRAAEAEANDILFHDRDVDDRDVIVRDASREEPRVSTRDSGRTAGTAGPSRLLFSVSETFDPNRGDVRSQRFLARDDVEGSNAAPRTLHDETRRQSRQSLEAEKQRLELAVELERGAHQLHAAFVDMATLADGQGERVDSVEAHVATAAVAATRGAEMLKRAREYQKQRNKRLRCAGSIACVVALVAIAVVVAGFGAVV